MGYFLSVAIAVDQLGNALRGGKPDETISAWLHREHVKGKSFGRNIVNAIFFWQGDHCKDAYESEIYRRQLPTEYV